MTQSAFTWIIVSVLAATSVGLLINRDWRWSLGLLSVQYVGVFFLIVQYWPFGLAAVKLVTGWMAAAALGVTRLGLTNVKERVETSWPQGRLFAIFASAMVGVLVAAVTPQFEVMIPGISRPIVAGAALLFGMGLLQLGLTSETLRVILGLLTLLSGFETIYAAVETSILLTGLLALINLGLALVGSYLMLAAHQEDEA